jgi:hypothetical protein
MLSDVVGRQRERFGVPVDGEKKGKKRGHKLAMTPLLPPAFAPVIWLAVS